MKTACFFRGLQGDLSSKCLYRLIRSPKGECVSDPRGEILETARTHPSFDEKAVVSPKRHETHQCKPPI